MGFLSDGRFWVGLILGIAGYYAWMRYQVNKAQ